MSARKSNADGAAGRSALRLDQLPAEVRAGELAPRLSPQGQRRFARRGLAAPPRGAAWSVQVIQACAVQLAAEDNYWRNPRGLTQAFLLPTVCRCAPHLSGKGSSQEPAAAVLCLRPNARDRRFKEALEQPFWSKLEWDLVAGLWRALGQPGAPLLWLLYKESQ